MAKKQTRRSISVSRTTYERLKAFCETNNISMSQLVETRVNDFLGNGEPAPAPAPVITAMGSSAPARPLRPLSQPPMMSSTPPVRPEPRPAPVSAALPTTSPTSFGATTTAAASPAQPAPMTSAAARFVVEPPPPIIKPRQDTAAPKPAEKRPEQIFTF